MYSSQVASYDGNQSIYHFRRTLTTVPIVDKSSLLNFSRPGLDNPGFTKTDCHKNDSTSDKSKMSIAFREVYKEYSSEMKENQFHLETSSRKDKLSDNSHMADKLLFSSDNARPKSRAKMSQNNNDLPRVPDIHSATDDTPVSGKELTNGSNNAHDYIGAPIENNKKGKKSRKRSNSSVKNKKGKHGRLLAATTSLQTDKRTTAAVNTLQLKPSRVSSEPLRKITPSAILTYTVGGQEHDTHKQLPLSTTNKPLHDLLPTSCTTSAKSNSNSVPNERHPHDTANHSDLPLVSNGTFNNDFSAQGTSVVVYKLDIGSRIKSASSIKTQSTIATEGISTKEVEIIGNTELSLSSVPCAIQHVSRSGKPVIKFQKRTNSNQGLSNDSIIHPLNSKETVLASIYGTVYHTADKVSAQAEELKKVKKIFLSDRQSGTIRENGMEFPCAPPATPQPDVLRNHEYIPSMSDIRSQRAVKGRLQAMEKEAQKKREKQKEVSVKLEKQQLKDREKLMKTKQRREIYALNKIMTELENKRFLDFCQAKGLNKV